MVMPCAHNAILYCCRSGLFQEKHEILQYLRLVCRCVTVYALRLSGTWRLMDLELLIMFLNLFQAAGAYPQLQQAVARMCLAWWQSGARNRESLVTQTIPYYLVAALSTGDQHTSAIRVSFPIRKVSFCRFKLQHVDTLRRLFLHVDRAFQLTRMRPGPLGTGRASF